MIESATVLYGLSSSDTFCAKTCASSVLSEVMSQGWSTSVDLFAKDSELCDVTNDLNPETRADHCMDAVECVPIHAGPGVLFVVDPPYSETQVKRKYKTGLGKHHSLLSLSSALFSAFKESACPGMGVLWCCWSSKGMGLSEGWKRAGHWTICHGLVRPNTQIVLDVYT